MWAKKGTRRLGSPKVNCWNVVQHFLCCEACSRIQASGQRVFQRSWPSCSFQAWTPPNRQRAFEFQISTRQLSLLFSVNGSLLRLLHPRQRATGIGNKPTLLPSQNTSRPPPQSRMIPMVLLMGKSFQFSVTRRDTEASHFLY